MTGSGGGGDQRRSLYNGFAEALAQAIEFAAVPVLFALFGLFLDGRLGTGHAFTVALAAFGIVGVVVRSLYHYKAQVEAQEEGKPWTRRRR